MCFASKNTFGFSLNTLFNLLSRVRKPCNVAMSDGCVGPRGGRMFLNKEASLINFCTAPSVFFCGMP